MSLSSCDTDVLSNLEKVSAQWQGWVCLCARQVAAAENPKQFLEST